MLALAAAVLALAGCNARALDGGDGSYQGDDASTATADGPVDPDDGVFDSGPIDDGDEWDAGHEGGFTGGGDDCGSFLGCEDVNPLPHQCDFWAQDCPDGEKCIPIASTPGSATWDAHVCVPAGTGEIGEPCTVADGTQGTDTCNQVSQCYDIDPETGLGWCIGFCLGPEAAPTCPVESGLETRCRQSGQGFINLCIASCNPLLAGECPTGQNCVAVYEGLEPGGFICFPPVAEGTSGDECSCANCCAEHHMCVTVEDYGPGCAYDLCCTEYCDVNDTSFACQGADQVCVPLFDPSTPEVGNIGRCVVP